MVDHSTRSGPGDPVAAVAVKVGQPISLRDVAKMADVSVATVSMVLNNNPRISRPTHLHVQRVIERVGYKPNRIAQSLSSKYTRVIAIMVPALRHAFADAYFGELISGVCDSAGRLGYKVILEQAKPEYIQQREHLEIYERRHVDGVVCMGVRDTDAFLHDFADGGAFPFVVADNYFPSLGLDHVIADHSGGTVQAMNYLLQLGHRKIGLIWSDVNIRTTRDKIEVYESKLLAAGVTPRPEWQADGQFTEAGSAEAAAAILAGDPGVTAILAGNDKMAFGALHHLVRAGVRVPEDVSVVGFEDMQQSAFFNPSLTTVHVPLYEVGQAACERLIERIRGKTERISAVLPTHLVVRESTAMAAGFAAAFESNAPATLS